MTFTISFLRPGVNRLAIAGTLDATTTPELTPMLDVVLEPRPRQVKIDLSKLHMIDRIGLALLVGFVKRARARRVALSVRGLRDQPLTVFRVLGADRMLTRAGVDLHRSRAYPDLERELST
jgi:anti-anti-sigma factor